MPRETITVETPRSKQKVELKTYLIGREKRALQNIFLGKELSVNLDAQNISGLNSSLVTEAQNLAWTTVIVSIDGHKEGDIVDEKPFSIVETILDMRGEDYDFVVAEVNKVTNEKKS